MIVSGNPMRGAITTVRATATSSRSRPSSTSVFARVWTSWKQRVSSLRRSMFRSHHLVENQAIQRGSRGYDARQLDNVRVSMYRAFSGKERHRFPVGIQWHRFWGRGGWRVECYITVGHASNGTLVSMLSVAQSSRDEKNLSFRDLVDFKRSNLWWLTTSSMA